MKRWWVLFGIAGMTWAQRPPVVLVDGFHLLCQRENLTSQSEFGELEKRLNDQGVTTRFFGSCTVSAGASIEELGNALGQLIRGMNAPQVDVVSHSMGGLVVRSYLAGKQAAGAVYSPPPDPQIRRWVAIATPNFGALIPSIALPFLPSVRARQMVPASQFLFDLATWNQNQDDLRGVETVAIVGNAGGVGPLAGSSDGTVAVTSASFSFALPDERTRVVPYCHGAGDLTSILGLGCEAPPLAKIQSDNPLSWQIIDSFLAGTEAWKTVGRSPREDPFLSKVGGVLRQVRDRLDVVSGALSDLPFETNALLKGGYRVVIQKPGPVVALVCPSAARLGSLTLAPRMLISIYGSGLAASTVTLNGSALAVSFNNDNQINALLPAVSPGLARLTVTNGQGTQSLNVSLESAAPAVFTLNGSGVGPAAAIHTQDYLSLYLTGLGTAGAAPVVELNGQALPVTYAGAAPGYAGLDQINVRLPAAQATGTIIVRAGGRVSNAVTVP